MTTRTELEQITLIAEEHMKNINASLFGEFGEDALKNAISHYQNETLVDNVLFGNEFECEAKKFNAINDERVNFDNIDYTKFVKIIDKRVKGELMPVPIDYICVNVGYGNKQKVDEVAYFTDVYDGCDKETIRTAFIKRNSAFSAMRTAIAERVTAGDGTHAALDSTLSIATIEYETSAQTCADILASMPELVSTWKSGIKAVNDQGKDKHMDKQAFFANVCMVLRISIKMDKMIEAQDNMVRRMTQQKSMAKMMKAVL